MSTKITLISTGSLLRTQASTQAHLPKDFVIPGDRRARVEELVLSKAKGTCVSPQHSPTAQNLKHHPASKTRRWARAHIADFSPHSLPYGLFALEGLTFSGTTTVSPYFRGICGPLCLASETIYTAQQPANNTSFRGTLQTAQSGQTGSD